MYLLIVLTALVLSFCANAKITPHEAVHDKSMESICTEDLPFDPYDICKVPPVSIIQENKVTDSDLQEPEDESILSDLIDKTKSLLIIIKDYIVSKVQNIINTILKKVNAKISIDLIVNVFKNKLDQIIQKARKGVTKKISELKNDICQCVTENENKFKDLLKSFLINEEHCVVDEIHTASNIAQNTKNTILSAVKRVETLPGEIATCLMGNDKLNCVKKDVWDVAKTEEQAFKKFVSQFTSVASFITGFESRVAACARDQLGKAAKASFNIVEKFPDCVIDKVIN